MTTLLDITERLAKPGLMSALGVKRESTAMKELKSYFVLIAKHINALELGQLVATGANRERVLGIASTKISQTLTRLRPILYAVLATNLQQAYLEGYHLEVLRESSTPQLDELLRQASKAARAALTARRAGSVHGSPIDRLGPSGKAAAEFAATQAASLVTGIDKTTRQNLEKLIAQAIEEQLGPDKLARMIQQELQDEAALRSKLIAQTEMNNAFSQAALDKMHALNFEYKELVPSEDACPICVGIAAEGPVPIDQPFSNGSMRTPIHVGCRCAIVAARNPRGASQ